MAPARPCRRFRYFKHFIQPLGGIVTCTPKQLPIVKEGSEAFNGYSFKERKFNEFGGICVMMCELCFAQRDLSLPVYFSLPSRTMWPRIFKKNVSIIARSQNIYVYNSCLGLTRFSFCRLFISALDAFQEVVRYGFKLLFHADDDAKGFRSSISSAAKRGQNRHGQPICNISLIASERLRLMRWS